MRRHVADGREVPVCPIELAKLAGLPILIHTPHRDKIASDLPDIGAECGRLIEAPNRTACASWF